MVNYISRLRKPLYAQNVAILRSYDGQAYKLTVCRSVRNKGVELPETMKAAKGTVNTEKLSNNIVRARSKIREYGLCNPWEYFCTFTIDKTKYDRYNLKEYHKALAQWIRDYNKKHGTNIRYLFIPEQHEDGAWHEHGFLMGLPLEHLTAFTLQDRLPHYIRGKLKKGETIYNWSAYAKKFGFVDIEPIRSRSKATSYITKYITKDLQRSVSEIGAHLYYCSQGLKRSEEIKRGTMAATIAPDFENEYCCINWFDSGANTDELQGYILSDKDIVSREEAKNNDLAKCSVRIYGRPANSWEFSVYPAALPGLSGSVYGLYRPGYHHGHGNPAHAEIVLSAAHRTAIEQYHDSDLCPGIACVPDMVLPAGIYHGQSVGEIPVTQGTAQSH